MNPTSPAAPKSTAYLKFVSILQVIGIILVVAGHSLHEYPDGNHGFTCLAYRLIYSFHMPLFLFISGLLMVYASNVLIEPKYRPGQYIRARAKRLLLPFIFLTALTFLPRGIASGAADDPYPLTAQNFLMAFISQDNMPIPFFWYLQACFILLVLSFVFLYVCNRRRISAGVSLGVLCVLFLIFNLLPVNLPAYFAIDKIKMMGIYFCAGAVYCFYSRQIDRVVPWSSPVFLVVSICVWLGLFIIGEGSILELLYSLWGIAMCISLAKIIEARGWSLFDHLAGANYLIYLISWYCNIGSQQLLAHFVSLPWWIHTALSLVTGIYIPWMIYVYMGRHIDNTWIKKVSFLLGQTYRRGAT